MKKDEPRVYTGHDAVKFARRAAAEAIKNPKNKGVADELLACIEDAERRLRASDAEKQLRNRKKP